MVAAVSAARAAAGVVPARLHSQKGVTNISRRELTQSGRSLTDGVVILNPEDAQRYPALCQAAEASLFVAGRPSAEASQLWWNSCELTRNVFYDQALTWVPRKVVLSVVCGGCAPSRSF